MSDKEAQGGGGQPRSEAWKTAVTMVQETTPLAVPAGASGMTIVVEWPPATPATPPHRHSGPAFGYVLEGAVRFELAPSGGRTETVPSRTGRAPCPKNGRRARRRYVDGTAERADPVKEHTAGRR